VKCDEYLGDKEAKMFDMSSIQLIPQNDTHTFLNGTIKFLQDMKQKWRTRVYTEKKVQGQWLMQAFDRTYDDLCVSMFSPLEPFHKYVKDMKKCPLQAAVSLLLN
jgi:hypothetical protein